MCGHVAGQIGGAENCYTVFDDNLICLGEFTIAATFSRQIDDH